MQLTPLAIALQGIGYGSHLTAVQGLAAAEEAAPARVNLVITRAWLQQMRARRLALAPKARAREKTRRQVEEELEEVEQLQAAQAAHAARLRLAAEHQAAEREAQAVIARAQADAANAQRARAQRRRRQQQLVVLLAH